MSKFSERFKLLKEHEGITNKELAERLGMLPATLGNYLQGREPSYDVLMKIASYYNVSVDWLIGYSEFREESVVVDSIQDSAQFKSIPELVEYSDDPYALFKEALYPLMARFQKIGVEADAEEYASEFWDNKVQHLLDNNSSFSVLTNSFFLNSAIAFLFHRGATVDHQAHESYYKSDKEALSASIAYLKEKQNINNIINIFTQLDAFNSAFMLCDTKAPSSDSSNSAHEIIEMLMSQFLIEHPLEPAIAKFDTMVNESSSTS